MLFLNHMSSAKAEVNDLNLLAVIHKNILQLQVPMRDIVLVAKINCWNHLAKDFNCPSLLRKIILFLSDAV